MKLQLKRSNVLDLGSAKEPTAAQMEYGELAVNYNNGDPAIFLKDSNDNIIRIAGVGNINSGDTPSGDVLPPNGNQVGDVFFNTTNNTMYYWDGSQWVPIANDVTAADIFVGTLAEIDAEVPANERRNGFLWWNTEDGTLYIWYIDANTSQFVIAIPSTGGGGGGASVAVNNVPPTNANQGDMWWNTTDGRLYIWYQDEDTGQWVDASPDSQVSPITSGENFPTTGLENDMFFNTTDGRLYIYYNDGSSLQWVDASPDSQGAIYWDRTGTTLKPANDGDNVEVDGRITAAGNIGSLNTIYSGLFDLNSDSGSGSRLTASSGVTAQRAGTVAGYGTLYAGYYGSTQTFHVGADGRVEVGGVIGSVPNISLAADGSARFASSITSGTPSSTNFNGGVSINPTGRITAYATPEDFSSIAWGSASSVFQVVSKDINDAGDLIIQAQWRKDGGIRIGDLKDSTKANVFIKADGDIILQKGLETHSSVGHRFSRINANQTWDIITSGSSGGFFGIYDRTNTRYAIRYYDNGTSAFDGDVSASGLFINLEADDDTKYTATTNEDGEQTLVYNGATLDVKALLLTLQTAATRIETLEAEVQALKGGN